MKSTWVNKQRLWQNTEAAVMKTEEDLYHERWLWQVFLRDSNNISRKETIQSLMNGNENMKQLTDRL